MRVASDANRLMDGQALSARGSSKVWKAVTLPQTAD